MSWTVRVLSSARLDGHQSPEKDCVVMVPAECTVRLPDALLLALPELFPTNSAAKRACRNKGGPFRVSFRDALGRCETELKHGDEVFVMKRASAEAQLDIVYEDESVMVVWKPAGMVMHGSGSRTLAALVAEVGAEPCHRLDAPTEGLVVCSRTDGASRHLHAQFLERVVAKQYCAVVHGQPDSEGQISSPVEDREAITRWRVRWAGHSPIWGPISCLDLWPLTGRKHQLRRHCADVLGMPILGDVRYCEDSGTATQRQVPLFLAAVQVSFNHPEDGRRIELQRPEPKRFQEIRLLQADTPFALRCEAIRAGRRQSAGWNEAWEAFCRAEDPHLHDGDGERDPRKHTESSILRFLAANRAAFEGALWVPSVCWDGIPKEAGQLPH